MTLYFSKKTTIGFSIFATLLLFAFSGSHPTTGSGGYTGAPNDNVCTTCHTPSGSLNGNIVIDGLPATVTANTLYPLTVTITNTAGSAAKAGFQMVSLKSNLSNGGTFSVPVTESSAQVKTAAGKSYVGHQPAKNFAANQIIYNVNWTAPASATGAITLYAASMIANGNGSNSGDKFVTSTVAVTIGSSAPLSGTFSNIASASCFDSNDGSATINVSGGSGNYSYNWDNGESNATAIMLSGGLHNVTVSDDAGAQIIESVTIGSPTALMPGIIFQTDAICNASMTGTAELNCSGGTPGYFYDWGNGIIGPIQNNLAADNYFVTVTDLNGCTNTISVFINQPPPIQISTIILDEPTCNGDADGTIGVFASGGNGGFTYNWLDGIGTPNQGTLSFIPAGDYDIEVIDSEGCTNQTTISLGEPNAVTSTVTGTQVLCFGDNTGTATATGAGGSGGFTYAWSNGGAGATQSGLIADIYQVTITDSDNCSAVNSYQVTQPATAVEAGISVIDQPNCGNQDGELSAFGLGGTPGYTYLWSTNSTSPVLSNIGSGIYTVTVTDLNNCTAEGTVTLQDNDGVSLAANNVGNNDCPGGTDGTATISASGGSGIYAYLWSNGGTNATENNLPAGFYTITVTDDGNCSGEIMIEITEPDAFETNEILIDITCNGAENGSIQLMATGGNGGLTYMWNTGSTEEVISDLIPGIFSVTVTDSNNCTGEFEFVIAEPDAIIIGTVDSNSPACPGDMNGSLSINPSGGSGTLSFLWNNGETTATITDLMSGDYSVTITDENNCEVPFEFTLDDPTVLSISSSTTPPLCSDSENGSATLSLIGGTGNYSIEWSTGDMTLTIANLPAGSYTVTVTDDNNCSTDAAVNIVAPLDINPTITSTNETSNGAMDGTVISNPINGTAPYTYLWSTGDTTQSIQNLSPGAYGLTVTDANNCTATATALINSGDCNITSEITQQHISCFGLLDGSISVELTGAVDPITYKWSDGSTDENLTNLGAGEYSVTISDANNCQIQILDVEITEPIEIIATDPIITAASSSTASDGSIEIEFSGGSGTLTIEFTDGNGTPIGISNFENLESGSYGVRVTDENGCEKFFGPFVVDFIAGLDDADLIIANVFPNPAQSFFIIETEANLNSNPSIYSVNGQLIEATFERDSDKYTFDSSRLPNGVYYIKLVSETDIVLKKIIITK